MSGSHETPSPAWCPGVKACLAILQSEVGRILWPSAEAAHLRCGLNGPICCKLLCANLRIGTSLQRSGLPLCRRQSLKAKSTESTGMSVAHLLAYRSLLCRPGRGGAGLGPSEALTIVELRPAQDAAEERRAAGRLVRRIRIPGKRFRRGSMFCVRNVDSSWLATVVRLGEGVGGALLRGLPPACLALPGPITYSRRGLTHGRTTGQEDAGRWRSYSMSSWSQVAGSTSELESRASTTTSCPGSRSTCEAVANIVVASLLFQSRISWRMLLSFAFCTDL